MKNINNTNIRKIFFMSNVDFGGHYTYYIYILFFIYFINNKKKIRNRHFRQLLDNQRHH